MPMLPYFRPRRFVAIVALVGVMWASSLDARADNATTYRDAYGVPHIYADTPEAAAYALGIAQCEDSLKNVVHCLHAGVGRISEVFGPGYRNKDIEARKLRHRYYAELAWPKLDVKVQRIVVAFCAGVNQYLNEHPNELGVPVAPIEPIQVIAWQRALMIQSAMKICEAEAESFDPDAFHPYYGPDGTGDTPPDQPGIEPGKSNSWAISGSKTAAGVPMLLIDPHWAPQGNLQLYEAYLHAGELQAGGFMLGGTPIPSLGVSPVAAWTVTAGGADSSDAFGLRINPDNPHQYEMDGKWIDMDVRNEVVKIRDGDQMREETIEVLETQHGPVLETKSGVPYAAAVPGYRDCNVIEQTYRIATARNTKQLKAAVAMDRYSYFNFMWATAQGDIGYVQLGQVPLRPEGFQWNRMVPGWTSKSLYKGKVPFKKIPAVENPSTGFLQNCNVAANVVTPGLTFTIEDFPIGALWGHYGQYRARGARATELLSDVQKATLADGRRIAFDTYVPPADLWMPVILQAYEENANRSASDISAADQALLAEAVELLRRWDRFATRESTGATVFRFWRLACDDMKDTKVGRDDFSVPNTPEIREDAIEALLQAAKTLNSTFGTVAVPWGDIKRLKRGDQEWALSGDSLRSLGMDTLRATGADELDDENKLIMNGGQCVTTVVLLTNPPQIQSVVAYGQSNKKDSPHYDDQAQLFSNEQFRIVPWTLEDLKPQVTSKKSVDYRPAGKPDGNEISDIEKMGGRVEYLTFNFAPNAPKHIDLSGTNITDEDLTVIARTPNVMELNLQNTKITDAGLKIISSIPNFEGTLNLSDTGITDAGLENLKTMDKLRGLYLGNTAITDEGLKYVGMLPKLQLLDLHNTAVTNSGLEHLATLKRIQLISVVGTKVTKEGATKLSDSVPTVNFLGVRPLSPALRRWQN